jgi:hypothetical protein
MAERKNWGEVFWVPKTFLQDREWRLLSMEARVVYILACAAWHDPNRKAVIRSFDDLVSAVLVHPDKERTILRALRELVEAGRILADGRIAEDGKGESASAKSQSERQDDKRFLDALRKYLSQFLVRDLSREPENLSRDKKQVDGVTNKNLSRDLSRLARVETETETKTETIPPSPHGGPGVTDSSKFIYPMTDAEAASVGRLVAGWPGIGGVATPGVRGAFCAAHRVFGLDAEDLLAAVEEQKSHGWFSGDKKMPRLERWIGDRYWSAEFVEANASPEKNGGPLPAHVLSERTEAVPTAETMYAESLDPKYRQNAEAYL